MTRPNFSRAAPLRKNAFFAPPLSVTARILPPPLQKKNPKNKKINRLDLFFFTDRAPPKISGQEKAAAVGSKRGREVLRPRRPASPDRIPPCYVRVSWRDFSAYRRRRRRVIYRDDSTTFSPAKTARTRDATRTQCIIIIIIIITIMTTTIMFGWERAYKYTWHTPLTPGTRRYKPASARHRVWSTTAFALLPLRRRRGRRRRRGSKARAATRRRRSVVGCPRKNDEMTYSPVTRRRWTDEVKFYRPTI